MQMLSFQEPFLDIDMSTGRDISLSWLSYVQEVFRGIGRLWQVCVVACLLVGSVSAWSAAQTRDVGYGFVRPILDRLVREASVHPADQIWGQIADLAYRVGDLGMARAAIAQYPSIEIALRHRDIEGMKIGLRLKANVDCSKDEFPAWQLALVEIGELARAWEALETCPGGGMELWGWLTLAYARNAEFSWSLRAIQRLPAVEPTVSGDAGTDYLQRAIGRYGRGVRQLEAATYPVHRFAAQAMLAHYAILAGDRSLAHSVLASIDVGFWRAAAIAGMVVASLQVGDVAFAADTLEAAEADANLPKEFVGTRPVGWMITVPAPSWLERPQHEWPETYAGWNPFKKLEWEWWIGRAPLRSDSWPVYHQFFPHALMGRVSALRWEAGMPRLLEVLSRGAWGRSLEFDTINVWVRRFDDARRISEQLSTMRSSGYTAADLYLGLLARNGAYEEGLAFAATGTFSETPMRWLAAAVANAGRASEAYEILRCMRLVKSDLTVGVQIAYALKQAGRTRAVSALVERLLSVAHDAFVPERYSSAIEGFLYAELLHENGFHDRATEIWDLAARRDTSGGDWRLMMAVSKIRAGAMSLEQALAGVATADERAMFMVYAINDAANRGQAGQIAPLVEMLAREMAALPPWPVGDISSEALYQALIRLIRAGAASEAVRMVDFPPDLMLPALVGMLEAALGRSDFYDVRLHDR